MTATYDPDPMPVFVLKGKDRLALDTIHHYKWLCREAGLLDQADEVEKAVDEMVAWRVRNFDRVQFPDHPHVPVAAAAPRPVMATIEVRNGAGAAVYRINTAPGETVRPGGVAIELARQHGPLTVWYRPAPDAAYLWIAEFTDSTKGPTTA